MHVAYNVYSTQCKSITWIHCDNRDNSYMLRRIVLVRFSKRDNVFSYI